MVSVLLSFCGLRLWICRIVARYTSIYVEVEYLSIEEIGFESVFRFFCRFSNISFRISFRLFSFILNGRSSFGFREFRENNCFALFLDTYLYISSIYVDIKCRKSKN